MENYMDMIPDNLPQGMNGVYNAIIIDDMMKSGSIFFQVKKTKTGKYQAIQLTNIKTILYEMYQNLKYAQQKKQEKINLILTYNHSLYSEIGVFSFDGNNEKLILLLDIKQVIETCDNILELFSKIKDNDGEPFAFKCEKTGKLKFWTDYKNCKECEKGCGEDVSS